MIKKIAMNRTIRTVVALTLVGVLTFSNIGDFGLSSAKASGIENDINSQNEIEKTNSEDDTNGLTGATSNGSEEGTSGGDTSGGNNSEGGAGEETNANHHSHSFDGATAIAAAGGKHVLTCTAAECDESEGYQRVEDCSDEDSDGSCDVCGATLSENPEKGQGDSSNSEGNENQGNQEKIEEEEACDGADSPYAEDHTATIIWNEISDTVGVHTGTCSVCETVVEKACDMDVEEGVCPVCGFGEEENPSLWEKLLGLLSPQDNHEHVFDKETKLCTICNLNFEDSHTHVYGVAEPHTCTVTYVKAPEKDGEGKPIPDTEYILTCSKTFATHTHDTDSQPWVSDGEGNHYKQCSIYWGTPGTKNYGRCDHKTTPTPSCDYKLHAHGKLICKYCGFDQSEKESLSIRGVLKWNDTDVDGKDWHRLIRPSLDFTDLLTLEATNDTYTDEKGVVTPNFSSADHYTTLYLKYGKSATAEENYCSLSELESGDEWQYLITNVPRYKYYRITLLRGEEGAKYYEDVCVVTTETQDSTIVGAGIVVEPKDMTVDPIMGKFKICKEMLGKIDNTAFNMNVSFHGYSNISYKDAGGTISLKAKGAGGGSASGEIVVEAPEGVMFTVTEEAKAGYVVNYQDRTDWVEAKTVADSDLKPAVVYNIPLDQTVEVEKLWNDNNDSTNRMGQTTTADAQTEWKKYLKAYYVLAPEDSIDKPTFDSKDWASTTNYKKIEDSDIAPASDWAELDEQAATKLGFSSLNYSVATKSFNNWTSNLLHGTSDYKTLFPSYYITNNGTERYKVYYQIKEEPIKNESGELLYTASVKKDTDTDLYVITNTKLTEFEGKIQWKDTAITNEKVSGLARPNSVTVELFRTSPGETASENAFRTRIIAKTENGFAVTDEAENEVDDLKVTLSDEGNTWNLAFDDLAMYDVNGYSYTYSLKEKTPELIKEDGADATYKIRYDNGTGAYAQHTEAIFYQKTHPVNSIINTLFDTTTFKATKQWHDQGGDVSERPNAVLALYRYPASGTSAQASPAVIVTASGTKILSKSLDTSTTANGSYTFDFTSELGTNKLPKYDENGDLYIYFVKEIYDEAQAKTTKYVRSYKNVNSLESLDETIDAAGAGNGGTIINSNVTKSPFTVQMDWLTQSYQNGPAKATVYLQVQKKVGSTWENVYAYDVDGNVIESTNSASQTTNTIKLEGFNSSILSQSKTIYLDRIGDDNQAIEYRLVEVRVEIAGKEPVTFDAPTTDVVNGPVFNIDDHRYVYQPYTYYENPATKEVIKTGNMSEYLTEETVATLYCSNALSDVVKYQAVKRWSPKPQYPTEENAIAEPTITLQVTQRDHDNKATTGVTSSVTLTRSSEGVTREEKDGYEYWYYTFEKAGANNGQTLQMYDQLGYQYVYRLEETKCDAIPSNGESNYYRYVTINEAYKSTVTNYTSTTSTKYVYVDVKWVDDGDAQNREKAYVQLQYVIGGVPYSIDDLKTNFVQARDKDGQTLDYYTATLVDKDGVSHKYKIENGYMNPILNNSTNGVFDITANMGWHREIAVPAKIYEIKEVSGTDEEGNPITIPTDEPADSAFKYQFQEISLGASSAGDHFHEVKNYTKDSDYEGENGAQLKDLCLYYGSGDTKSIDMVATEKQVYSVSANHAVPTEGGSSWEFTNKRIGLVDYTVYKVWEDGNGISVLADFVDGKGSFDPSEAVKDESYVDRPDITITLHRVGDQNTTTFDRNNNQIVTIKSSKTDADKLSLSALKGDSDEAVDTADYTLTIVDKNTWKYTFKHIPKYASSDGELLEYMVSETTASTNTSGAVHYDTNMKEKTDADHTEQAIKTGDESRYFVKNLRSGTTNYTMYVQWKDGQSTERPDVYVQLYYKIDGTIYKYGADKAVDIANNVYIGDELDFVWRDAPEADAEKYDRYCYIYGLNEYDKNGAEITYFTSATLSTVGDYKNDVYETVKAADNLIVDKKNLHPVSEGSSTYLAPDNGCVAFRLDSVLEVNGIKSWQNLQTGTRMVDLDPDYMPIIMLMRTRPVKQSDGTVKQVIVPFSYIADGDAGGADPEHKSVKQIFTKLDEGFITYKFTSGMHLTALSGTGQFSKNIDIDGDGTEEKEIDYSQAAGILDQLEKYDEEGNQYNYTAVEVLRGGMYRVYNFSDNSFTLTNTYETDSDKNSRSVYVSKNWDFSNLAFVGYDVNKMNSQNLYPTLTFELYRIEKGKETKDGSGNITNDWTKDSKNLVQTKKVDLNTGKVTTTIDGVSKTVDLGTACKTTQGVDDKGTLTDDTEIPFTEAAKSLTELAFTDLRIWSENGLQYVYAVKEIGINGYTTYNVASVQKPGGAAVDESTLKYQSGAVCVLNEIEFTSNNSVAAINDAKVVAKFANQYEPGHSIELVGQKNWVDQASTELRPETLELEILRKANSGETAYTDITDKTVYKWMNSPVENPEKWQSDLAQAKNIAWKEQSYGGQKNDKHYWAYYVTNKSGEGVPAGNKALAKWAPNGTEFVYMVREVLDSKTANYYTNTASGCRAESYTANGCANEADDTNKVTTKILQYNLINKLNVNYTVKKTWEDGSNRYQLRPSGLIAVLQRRTVKGEGASAEPDAWEFISPYALSDGSNIPLYSEITDAEKLKAPQICKVPITVKDGAISPGEVVAVRMPNTATSTYTFANLPAAKVVSVEPVVEGGPTTEIVPYQYRALEYAIIGTNGALRKSKYGEGDTEISFTKPDETNEIYNTGSVGAYHIKEEFENSKLTITNTLISAKLQVTKKWDDNHNQYETRPTNGQGTPYINFYLKYAFTSSGDSTQPSEDAYQYLTVDGGTWNGKTDKTDNRLKNTMTFSGDEFTYTFTNLPNVDIDGNRYWYTVEEVINKDLDSYTDPNTHKDSSNVKDRITVNPTPQADETYIYVATIINKLKILEKEEDEPISGTVSAHKVWIGEETDANENFGHYPKVKLTLIRYIKKKKSDKFVLDNYLTDKTITLDGQIDPEGLAMRESDQWTATWSGLPATDNIGQPYKYYVKEESVPENYEYIGIQGKLIENRTAEEESGEISSTNASESTDKKSWNPENENDTVELFNDINWNYEFNIYNRRLTSLTVEKDWLNDENNAFHTRPDELTITLQRRIASESALDGAFEDVDTVKLTDADHGVREAAEGETPATNKPADIWRYTFDNLPLYSDDGKRYEYRAVEDKSILNAYIIKNGLTETYQVDALSKANSEYNNTYSEDAKEKAAYRKYTQTITNTLRRVSQLDVSVIWDDAKNQDGIRPDKVNVQLCATVGSDTFDVKSKKDLDPTAEGEITYNKDIEYDETNKWVKIQFEHLPIYTMKNGTLEKVVYSVREKDIENATEKTGYKTYYGLVIDDEVPNYSENSDGQYAKTELDYGVLNKEIRVKNVHVPDTTNKEVTKNWENLSNVPSFLLDEAQPNKIKVYLQKRYVKKGETDASKKYLTNSGELSPDFGSKDAAYMTFVANAATTPDSAPGTDKTAYSTTDNDVALSANPENGEWKATWYKQPVNYNPTGTAEDPGISYGIEYSVVEKDWNELGTTSGEDITEDDAEAKAVGAFTSKVSAESSNAFTVTNTLQKTELVVTKVWIDENDKYATRPTSLSFVLQRRIESGAAGSATFVNVKNADNDVVMTLTSANVVSGDTNKWSGTFSNLPIKDEHGYIISYRAVEVTKLAEESSLLDAYNCTNGTSDDTHDINVTVTYKAPDADSEKTTGTINKTAYVATDKEVESYAQKITNTLRKEGAIKVAKVWDDANNRDGLRPETVTMNLYRIPVTDGDTTAVAVTDSSSNPLKRELEGGSEKAWKASFGVNDEDKLPIYSAKNNKIEAIPYQIQETGVSNYTTTYCVDGYGSYVADYGTVNAVKPASDSSNVNEVSVKNTYIPAHTERQIEKIWIDNDADSKLASAVRPDSITVYLTATYKIYAENGTASDKEVFVDKNGTIITDAETGQPIVVPANATADQVPAAAKVTLNANQKNAAGNWIYIWTSSSMYVNTNESYVNGANDGSGYVKGQADPIAYKAYELPMNGYSHAIESVTKDSKETGYRLTNTMRTTYLDVTKVWVDENDGYKTRPNSIQVYLQQKISADSTYVNAKLADGENADGKDYVITLSENSENKAGKNGSTVDTSRNTWVGCFVNLPLYNKSQNLIEYRAVEIVEFEDGSNLTTVYTPSNALLTENNNAGPASTVVSDTADAGVTMQHYTQTMTNTLKYGNIKVEKIWDDNSDEDDLRPTALKITLKRDDNVGTKKDAINADDNQFKTLVDTATKPASTNVWSGSFTSLPVGTAAGNNARLLKYTMEEAVDTTIDEDHNLVDYEQAHKVKDGDSVQEIGDGVELEAVEDATDISAAKIYQITNTLSVVEIRVEKVWDDQDDLFHLRPDQITVTLQQKADEQDSDWTDLKTGKLEKKDAWTVVFGDLHKFNTAGDPYLYRVVETPVTGYQTDDPLVVHDEEKGKDLQTWTFTNKLETVSVSGKVTFEGEDGFTLNQLTALRGETALKLHYKDGDTFKEFQNYPNGGDTAASIVPTYAQGQPVEANNSWTYMFANLPKYDKDGKTIVYAVKEDYSKRYKQTTPEASKDGVQEGQVNADGTVTKADFVNYLETFTVKGSKTWIDASNKFSTRPENIDIVIGYPDGATVGGELKSGTITWEKVDADGNPLNVWNYTITGLLRKDNDGQDMAYTFREGNSGETPISPLVDFNIKNYHNKTKNGNDNKSADSTYKTKYTGITALKETSEAAAIAASLLPCTGITYSTDANYMSVVGNINFINEAKTDAILGIHNVTDVGNAADVDRNVAFGGKVGVVVGDQTADKYREDIEAMDQATAESRMEFAVSWVADENWRYKDTFTITYYEHIGYDNAENIVISDYLNEDGTLKNIEDPVFDKLREVFKMDDHGEEKNDLAISMNPDTGEIKLVLGTSADEMKPATFVYVEFIPTIAIENKTAGYAGGVVQVEDGVAAKDGDGLWDVDGKPSYVGRTVMAKADNGYEIDLSYMTIAPLRKIARKENEPSGLLGKMDSFFTMRAYAADSPYAKKIDFDGDTFQVLVPAFVADSSANVEVTGKVVLTKTGKYVTGITLTLDKDTVPLEFGVVFKAIPKSDPTGSGAGTGKDKHDDNAADLPSQVVSKESKQESTANANVGPAKTSDPMPIGLLSVLGSVFVVLGAALRLFGRRKRKK